MFTVAIDGPSGVGKSSISRRVAKALGFTHVDTGAMYRAIAYTITNQGISPKDAEQVIQKLPEIKIKVQFIDAEQHIFVGEDDLTSKIHTLAVSEATSHISAIPEVRTFLLEEQRKLAKVQNIIMDGRDIGTVVLPHANLKIFLTASVEERANRRYQQMRKDGMEANYEDVLQQVIERDYRDTNRVVSPLRPALDAVIVDSTENQVEDTTRIITKMISDRQSSREHR